MRVRTFIKSYQLSCRLQPNHFIWLEGSITVRTHSSRRVVNRSSRFHTSAGLDDLDQSSTPTGRQSPCNGTGQSLSCSPNGSPLSSTGTPVTRDSLALTSSNNGLVNPRLPPLPHAYLIYPLAQIKTPTGPRCGGPCCTGSAQQSNKCNGRVGLEYSMGVAMKFAPSRGWLGGSPNTARAGRTVIGRDVTCTKQNHWDIMKRLPPKSKL